MLNVAMLGASGRMGRTIVPLIAASDDLRLSGALAAAQDASIGHDAGVVANGAALAVAVSSDPARALEGADVAIDFTLPAASLANARECLARKVPLVIGTTGHDEPGRAEIAKIAESLPVVMAPNMSLGVNLLFKLVELGARALDADYDVEIVEAHHRHKVDAPSGTALGLGRAVAQGRATTLEQVADYARHGATGPRRRGAVGFAVVRGGDIVGDHRVIFAGPGEQVELSHHAQDRSGFARGALVAARWVVGRPAGLYSMMDVLGL
jgi:4-hydroxy-tetrahydrodipicolinate reductase